MWNERECGEKRASAADIRSSWVIVAAILLGMAAWSNLQLLMTNTTAPIVANRETSTPDEIPLILNAIAPAAGPDSSAAETGSDKPRR